MSNHSVQIGPEFFAKVKSDYANWRFALIREFFQNCVDAPGCGSVSFTVEKKEVSGALRTVVTVENDGAPMSREVLLGKLLCLGGSTKDMVSSVGGFGVAKSLLYLCHDSYLIRTGTLQVVGSGGSYFLDEGLEDFQGTRSVIVLDEGEFDAIIANVKVVGSFSQWSGVLKLNGEVVSTAMYKGSFRREFSFGRVYTNRSGSNRLIVRVNGVLMFHRRVAVDRVVVLELSGRSIDVLTSNRDNLVWKYASELDEFCTAIVVDKHSALKRREPEYTHYSGLKLGYKNRSEQESREAQEEALPVSSADVGQGVPVVTLSARCAGSDGSSVLSDETVNRLFESLVERAIVEDFVLKSELAMVIPRCYCPDSSEFGSYSKKLAVIWGRLLLQLHRLFKYEAAFSIGFVFSEDEEAQFERGKFGHVYYVNPIMVVQQKNSSSRSLRRRFLLTERDRLLALAVHEFTHGQGLSMHDQTYANRLTDNFAMVMKHRKSFNWCFK